MDDGVHTPLWHPLLQQANTLKPRTLRVNVFDCSVQCMTKVGDLSIWVDPTIITKVKEDLVKIEP